MMNVRRATRAVAAVLSLSALALVGCGERTHVPNDEEKIGEVVSGLSDAAGSAPSFTAVFAADSAPPEKERAKYTKFSYRATDVKVSGETATATVDIISPFTDAAVGSAEWTCARQQGQWLLQAAPVPAELAKP